MCVRYEVIFGGKFLGGLIGISADKQKPANHPHVLFPAGRRERASACTYEAGERAYVTKSFSGVKTYGSFQ